MLDLRQSEMFRQFDYRGVIFVVTLVNFSRAQSSECCIGNKDV